LAKSDKPTWSQKREIKRLDREHEQMTPAQWAEKSKGGCACGRAYHTDPCRWR
jgi:hypothetical protein